MSDALTYASASPPPRVVDLPDTIAESGPITQELLLKLHEAYTRGTVRSPREETRTQQSQSARSSPAADPTVFGLGDVSEVQRRSFARGKYYCNEARKFAVQGDELMAWQRMAIAESVFKDFPFGSELQLLSQSELLSAEAAIEYQRKNYAGSQERLDAARATDRRLLTEFGKIASLAHGFHLASKQAQLFSAKRQFSEALHIASAGLCVLSGRVRKESSLPWPLADSDASMLSLGLCRFLSRQCTIEIGVVFLFASAADSTDLLGQLRQELEWPLDADPSRMDGLDSADTEWLRAKLLSARRESPTAHLEACASFLLRPRKETGVLRPMCALDAADRCVSLDSPLAQSFREVTLIDLSQDPVFPATLRNRWAKLVGSR